MLLRLETALLRRCLAEVKKQAKLMAKFGEYRKFGCRGRHFFFDSSLFLLYRNTIYFGKLKSTVRSVSDCRRSEEAP
jgi:hypothetical protein